MPIKQHRMMNLIKAAQQFKDAYMVLAEEVQRAQGKEDAAAEVTRLFGVLTGTAPQPQSYSIIDVEAYHFRKFARRNDRMRERMSQQRLTGIIQQQQPQRKRPTYKPALTEADLKAMLEKDYGDSGDPVKPEDLEEGLDIGGETEPTE